MYVIMTRQAGAAAGEGDFWAAAGSMTDNTYVAHTARPLQPATRPMEGHPMKPLPELIAGLPLKMCSPPGEAPSIRDLTDDSRQVQPGTLFIARRGSGDDGQRYIDDAIGRGAAGIVAPRPPAGDAERRLAWATGPDVDGVLTAQLADRFYDHPGRALRVLAVTGTNGKTTVAFLMRHLLAGAGLRCGLLGTVYNDLGEGPQPASLTTPGPIELHRWLRRMVDAGCRAVACELSSHGLAQGRAAHLAVDAAVFTNLSGDHLDYHGTMDAYAAAKARLFEALAPSARAVVNADDPWSGRIVADCPAPVVRCRIDGDAPAHWRARVLAGTARGSRIGVEGPGGGFEADLPLLGRYNVSNALLALAAVASLGDAVDLAPAELARLLAASPPVPGRLERVEVDGAGPGRAGGDALPTVLVDYAHTDDALGNVLGALRPLVGEGRRLVVVFGCGGDRDRGKRPRMAAVAWRLADGLVITSDNPRTEDPDRIIADTLTGLPPDAAGSGRLHVESDRAAAIEHAIASAAPGAVVLIAGKGHEDYQVIGEQRLHFNDREHAAAALARRSRAAGATSREEGQGVAS